MTGVTFFNIDRHMPQVVRLPLGKREQTKAQNRQAILRAARDVFAELGYETTTVRDIIRRTGLAAGTFYNYYRSKEEVFAALAAEGTRRFAPILKASRAHAQDYEGFVRAAITAFFEFLADEHNNWIAGRPPGEAVPQRRETPESVAVYEEVRAAVVEECQRNGLSADPDYLAAACIAIAREIGDQMLLRRPIDIPAAADFAVTMILTGMHGLPKAK
jgi:AcrR family transcriptional regulator